MIVRERDWILRPVENRERTITDEAHQIDATPFGNAPVLVRLQPFVGLQRGPRLLVCNHAGDLGLRYTYLNPSKRGRNQRGGGLV